MYGVAECLVTTTKTAGVIYHGVDVCNALIGATFFEGNCRGPEDSQLYRRRTKV
jgi:hypothetical protein